MAVECGRRRGKQEESREKLSCTVSRFIVSFASVLISLHGD